MNIFKGKSYKNAPTAELVKYQFFNFQDFCEKGLKKCSAGSKFEGYITIGDEYKITKGDPDAHFKSYRYKDHFHRNNPSQISAGLIPFDGDNSKSEAGCCIEPVLVHEALKEKNLNHCIYTTHSHRTKDHPDKIRWRLFLPCKMEEQGQLAPSIVNLYNLLAKNGCADLAMATESKTWSVPWFLPTRDNPDDGKFEFYSYYEGDDFEPSEAESIPSDAIISDDKISMDDMVLTIMNGTPDTGVHIAITKYIHGQKKDGVKKATVLANLKAFIHNWPYDDYHKRYYADMIRDLNNIYKNDEKALVGDWEKSWGYTAEEFCKMDFPIPKEYLSPWIVEENVILIVGERGVGKSWFAYGLSQAITSGEDFGPWKVENKTNIVYVDGEMGRYDNQKRMRLLKLDKEKHFTLICNHQTGIDGGVVANLVHEEYREWFKNKLIETDTKIVVLDNVSCLASGLDENSKKDWDEINQWMIQLKHAGITSILIHHMGKDLSSGGRGTSAREDNIDVNLVLTKPKNYQPEDKARMEIKFTKTRMEIKNTSAITNIEVKLKDGNWEFKKSNQNQKVLEMIHAGCGQKEIANITGLTQGQISKKKKKAIKDGVMDKNGKIIAFDLINNVEKRKKE